jgi:nicotinamidase-related amidase
MTTVLLLVDVQKSMLEPPEPVPDADAVGSAIKDLLGRARSAGTTVIHIRNNGGDGDPDVPGTPGWELVHEVVPGEHTVDKSECDAFAGTGLSGPGAGSGHRGRGRDAERVLHPGDVPGDRVRAPGGGRVSPRPR